MLLLRLLKPVYLTNTRICCKACIQRQLIFHFRVLSQSSENEKSTAKKATEVDYSRSKGGGELTTAEKVVEAGKTTMYLGVIIAGIGIIGGMVFFLTKGIFSSESPNAIYGDALALCRKNTQVQDTFGEPIKAHGEKTRSRRGRRNHVSSTVFMQNGVKHIRLIFYIEGPHASGTVHVEKKQDEKEKYQYVYVIVELSGIQHRLINVVDNR